MKVVFQQTNGDLNFNCEEGKDVTSDQMKQTIQAMALDIFGRNVKKENIHVQSLIEGEGSSCRI